MAPLARAAGGTEQCTQAVFRTKTDPDFQKIMAAFDQLKQKLEQKPRYDMMPLEDQWDSCREDTVASLH